MEQDKIWVRCEQTGDNAYANDQEAAVSCALTLMQEAREHGSRGTTTCSFYVAGKLVRYNLSQRDLLGAVL